MVTQLKKELIVKYTPEGERIEISPYIWGIMHGEPPLHLEDEERAIEISKKLGWKRASRWHPTSKPVGDEEMEEIHRILREHGIDPDEIDRILENGGGTLPGWNGKAKKRSSNKTEA